MSSRGAKEERGEQAARYAADQMKQAREQRESEQHAGYGVQHQEQRSGVIGSVMKAVQGTFDHAKEAVGGRPNDDGERPVASPAEREKVMEYREYIAPGISEESKNRVYEEDKTGESIAGKAGEKAKQAEDATARKAGEYKDYAAEKVVQAKDATLDAAVGAKDATVDKAKQAKDATARKAGEYKDYAADTAVGVKDATVDKAKQAKDATVDKAKQAKDAAAETGRQGKDTATGGLTGLKDSAADAAKRAMGYFSGNKDETAEGAKQRSVEAKEAAKNDATTAGEAVKEGVKKTGESASQKMEELRLRGEEAKRRENADWGEEQTGIFGAIKNVAGNIRENVAGGGTKETREYRTPGKGGAAEEVVKISAEETRPGMAADLLKASDQMAGQTFNDPGKMGGEGTGKSVPSTRRHT